MFNNETLARNFKSKRPSDQIPDAQENGAQQKQDDYPKAKHHQLKLLVAVRVRRR
jgi:hypothetical protein